MSAEASGLCSLENRPCILVIGSPNVGKRTLVSRLLSDDFEDAPDSSSPLLARGWTINTKYYTVDVSLWMAHLEEGFSVQNLPNFNQLTALVMVFDLSDLSTFAALQDWVSHTDIQNFEISLCIGNKVDLLPGHPVHAEYRRHLLKLADTSANHYSEITGYGISETEGSNLLGDEEPSPEIRRSCLEWCCERNIEFIEACASSADFDKCLSVDGDSQGIERLYGALSAYMWSGMTLKSGHKITKPSLPVPDNEELSEEESDYEFDYEVLSVGSADPWDETDIGWVSAHATNTITDAGPSSGQDNSITEFNQGNATRCDAEELHPSVSRTGEENSGERTVTKAEESDNASESEKGTHYEYEDLEQLMSEIGNIRDNLRLMPDFQRREMAANLAMKMAAMFGGDSDD